jgi:hypothetical protein
MHIGFSQRKAEFSLYVYAPGNDNKQLLEGLGKFIKIGKACIYLKKPAALKIDTDKKLSKATIS